MGYSGTILFPGHHTENTIFTVCAILLVSAGLAEQIMQFLSHPIS
jgi:hypothetical protein